MIYYSEKKRVKLAEKVFLAMVSNSRVSKSEISCSDIAEDAFDACDTFIDIVCTKLSDEQADIQDARSRINSKKLKEENE